jgi:hypothetical protein
MKTILASLMFLVFSAVAADYPACDVRQLRKVPLHIQGEQAELEVKIKGSPCYQATLELKVFAHGKTAYSYQAPFKPHVAIGWKDIDEQSAIEYVERAYSAVYFKNCDELLPAVLAEDAIYNYNTILVPAPVYAQFKASQCRAFEHQIHYEASRDVVFPLNTSEGIAVSEFGL